VLKSDQGEDIYGVEQGFVGFKSQTQKIEIVVRSETILAN